jgi:putative ABC transport system ATP-binding protein
VRDASKTYKSADVEVLALDRVSLELRAGELTGIVGPSGSGKTTFLMIAGLLEPPTEGAVRYSGEVISHPKAELNRLRELRRTKIGFVFQRGQLIPFLTALENVQIAMEINQVKSASARARARDLLKHLGVDERLNNYPSQLSGGEQQRVSIARALANDPILLLADEPTAALDAPRGYQVMRLFRELADERQVAVCVVTHDPRWVEFFDRTVQLHDGRILQAQGAVDHQAGDRTALSTV